MFRVYVIFVYHFSHVRLILVLGCLSPSKLPSKWECYDIPTVMRPAAIFFSFRFSSRRHSPTPLTATLRKPTAVTYSPWGSVSERMFYQGALRQNSSSGPEASRHPESAAQPCLRENEARCQCCQHWRTLNISQDQGGRSPFVDALLTALMGIGIGELQF
jgi:hypothetical protein